GCCDRSGSTGHRRGRGGSCSRTDRSYVRSPPGEGEVRGGSQGGSPWPRHGPPEHGSPVLTARRSRGRKGNHPCVVRRENVHSYRRAQFSPSSGSGGPGSRWARNGTRGRESRGVRSLVSPGCEGSGEFECGRHGDGLARTALPVPVEGQFSDAVQASSVFQLVGKGAVEVGEVAGAGIGDRDEHQEVVGAPQGDVQGLSGDTGARILVRVVYQLPGDGRGPHPDLRCCDGVLDDLRGVGLHPFLGGHAGTGGVLDPDALNRRIRLGDELVGDLGVRLRAVVGGSLGSTLHSSHLVRLRPGVENSPRCTPSQVRPPGRFSFLGINWDKHGMMSPTCQVLAVNCPMCSLSYTIPIARTWGNYFHVDV